MKNKSKRKRKNKKKVDVSIQQMNSIDAIENKINSFERYEKIKEINSIIDELEDEIDYEHYFGLINIDKDISENGYIICNNNKIKFKITLETNFEYKQNLKNQYLHLIVSIEDKERIAELICDDEFYSIFHLIDNVKDKLYKMRKYVNLSEGKKNAIIRQQFSTRLPLVNENKNSLFKSKEELRLKYNLCKDTYTEKQQMEIENLFKESLINDIARRQLEYVLNISPTFNNNDIPSYDKIIEELDKKIYGMKHVKEEIAECIVASKYAQNRSLRILLVGSSGTGKTRFGKAISEIYNLPYDTIHLNVVTSATDLSGLSKYFHGSDAGKFFQIYKKLGTSEAVIILEEIDKMNFITQKDGNPGDALLDTLSDEYICYDSFVDMEVKTNNTIYIATANSTQTIPEHIINRFKVIRVNDYEDEEKIVIAEKYIIPELLDNYHLKINDIQFSSEIIMKIIQNYTYDNGVRMLKENIASIIRHSINIMNKYGKKRIIVTDLLINESLKKCVDEKNPMFRYKKNKNKYSKEVKKEINCIIESLNKNLEEHKRQTYMQRLEYLTSLVSSEREINFDINEFYKKINASHYGMEKVKNRICEIYNSKKLKENSFTSERILLVGNPGIGKTSIVKSFAQILDLPFVSISLNGVNDESEIKGFQPTSVGSDCGIIAKSIYKIKSLKCLMLLDEVDKMGRKNGVDVSHTLLDLMDDTCLFYDKYLGVQIDVSDILFIATANDVSKINPILLNRFKVIYLDGYSFDDKKNILIEYILPKIMNEFKKISLKINFENEVIDFLIKNYAKSSGVRDLENGVRQIIDNKLCNNCGNYNLQITLNDVINVLGEKPIPRGNLLSENVAGYSQALAVSNEYGISFSVESTIIKNENSTIVTGLPKQSVIDSIKLAKTFIKRNYFDDDVEFHVHFGEGGVEKEGPSAGVAICISMLSALFKKPVSFNASFTGEIDLFGNIFAVGGIIQKIQAAIETDCKEVFIPKDNYERLSSDYINKCPIKIIAVKHVDEVIRSVLPTIVSQVKR